MISLFFTHSVSRFLQFVCIGRTGEGDGEEKLNLFYSFEVSGWPRNTCIYDIIPDETELYCICWPKPETFIVIFLHWIGRGGRRVPPWTSRALPAFLEHSSNELYFNDSTIIREMAESKRLVSQSEYVAMRTTADHCSVDCIKTKEYKIDILNIQGT